MSAPESGIPQDAREFKAPDEAHQAGNDGAMTHDHVVNGSQVDSEAQAGDQTAVFTQGEGEYASVKEYSRDQHAEERLALAAELREKRRDFATAKVELERQARAAMERREQLGLEAKTTRLALEECQQRLSDLKQSRLKVFFQRATIQELEVQRLTNVDRLQQLSSEEMRLEHELLQQSEDQSAVETIQHTLDDFYSKENKEWQDYEAERRIGDVVSVSRQHRALIVHGISRFIPHGNSPLEAGTSPEMKYDTLLGLQPSVSSSSIRPGDGRGKLWTSSGVILRGGKISEAHTGDAATKPRGFFGRSSVGGHPEKRLDQQITDAIETSNPQYNELVVDEPEVAAVYLTLDRRTNPLELTPQEVSAIAERLGLPLIALQDGLPYEAQYESSENKVIVGRALTQDEVLTLPGISENRRQELVQEIFKRSPFKIRGREYEIISGRDSGRQAFLELEFGRVPARFGTELNIEQTANDNNEVSGALLAEMTTVDGTKLTFYRRGNEILEEAQAYDVVGQHQEPITRTNNLTRYPTDLARGWTNLTPFRTMQLTEGSAVVSAAEYLQGIQKNIDQQQARLAEAADDGQQPAWVHETMQEMLETMAGHVYGFGEMAAQHGDHETAAMARQICQEILDPNTIQNIIDQRTDTTGRFKVTIDDFPELKKRLDRSKHLSE